MRTALGRVLYLGAAGGGTEHFWRQRVTAAANVLLVAGFIIVLMATVGRPHAEVVAVLGSPLISAMLVLMLASVAIHMRLGIQVVIEDYIHGEALKIVLLVAATFFSAAVGVTGIVAVLSMAFGG